MKWSIFFCSAALLFSCQKDFEGLEIQNDQSITSLNGTWKVVAYEDYERDELITKTEENSRGMDVIITFDDTTDPPSISGRNTTNRIFGSFEYTGQRSIRVPGLASTYVGQPEWGNKFTEIFTENELAFAINKNTLELSNESRQLSAILVKE